ncbi:hypothetical protein UVI_02021710 [Ustilaginoidea virens]|uniref:Copper homeostasis protein cutC homolog n=1 Tax=Ustilaginoidea virens TaxID=1159556 RepID=A0A1B5L7S2_USTVR|nr:hypothetical protein UVI_02021710 [Ustilaginoidea virens]
MPDTYTKLPLEVATFSGDSMLKAQAQAASRVELNAPGSYPLGGTTPPVSELARVARRITIPVRIMIRPRGPPADGSPDFVYSPAEVDQMARSVLAFKRSGLMDPLRGDGFVFGLLAPPDLSVDRPSCRRLVRLARPYGCVFHRAFDRLAARTRGGPLDPLDPLDALDALVDLGFQGVLTAGGPGPCAANVDTIAHLCHRWAGRLQIVVGGGLRHHNVAAVAGSLTGYEDDAVWLHTAALTGRPDHPDEEIDSDELVRLVTQLGSVPAPCAAAGRTRDPQDRAVCLSPPPPGSWALGPGLRKHNWPFANLTGEIPPPLPSLIPSYALPS